MVRRSRGLPAVADQRGAGPCGQGGLGVAAEGHLVGTVGARPRGGGGPDARRVEAPPVRRARILGDRGRHPPAERAAVGGQRVEDHPVLRVGIEVDAPAGGGEAVAARVERGRARQRAEDRGARIVGRIRHDPHAVARGRAAGVVDVQVHRGQLVASGVGAGGEGLPHVVLERGAAVGRLPGVAHQLDGGLRLRRRCGGEQQRKTENEGDAQRHEGVSTASVSIHSPLPPLRERAGEGGAVPVLTRT